MIKLIEFVFVLVLLAVFWGVFNYIKNINKKK